MYKEWPYLNKEDREHFWHHAPPWVKERMVAFLLKGFCAGIPIGAAITVYCFIL